MRPLIPTAANDGPRGFSRLSNHRRGKFSEGRPAWCGARFLLQARGLRAPEPSRLGPAKRLANYAILGPHDYLDIFEAPDETVAAKVVVIIRSFGHAETETWTALPWERFESLIPA